MSRALLVSFFLHAAAIALAFYLHVGPAETKAVNAEDSADGFEVQAPLGHVFVQEALQGATASDAKPEKEKERVSDSPMPLPGDVRHSNVAEEAASGPSGSPEGEAQPVGRIEPSYPPVSRRLGEEGEALFLLTIHTDGTVAAAELEKTSGHERLDSAARAALLAATFQVPEGALTQTRKRYRVEFRLENDAKGP